MKLRACLLAAVLLASPAAAQNLQAIDQKEAELVAAWEKSPLVIRKAVFVTEKAPLYGAYSPRPSSTFKRGETLLAYLEPVGYTWKPSGEGVTFGISLDVVLKSKDGKVLGGQEKFLNYQQTSRHHIRELMLNVNLNLGNTPPGDYVAEFTAHDLGDKKATIAMPFTIVE